MAAAVASSRSVGDGNQLGAGRGGKLRHGSPGLAHEDEVDAAAVVEHADAVDAGNGGTRFGGGVMRTAGDRFHDGCSPAARTWTRTSPSEARDRETIDTSAPRRER